MCSPSCFIDFHWRMKELNGHGSGGKHSLYHLTIGFSCTYIRYQVLAAKSNSATFSKDGTSRLDYIYSYSYYNRRQSMIILLSKLHSLLPKVQEVYKFKPQLALITSLSSCAGLIQQPFVNFYGSISMITNFLYILSLYFQTFQSIKRGMKWVQLCCSPIPSGLGIPKWAR